jgi:tetratricopeptide (TPR) repeat protein
MTDEELLDLRRFWRKEGLSDFWWGRGFFRPDEGQRHSYELSRVLFQLLLSDYQGKFREFFAQARAADAGESAARSALGMELGDLAAKFLGQGDWTPRPPDAATFCERASFHLHTGRLAEAIADAEDALRLEPGLSQAHSRLGDVCVARREYARAVSAFEKALDLSSRDLASCNMLAWLRATCPDEWLASARG